MRIATTHDAWTWPKQTRKGAVTLVVIIIVGVIVAAAMGQAKAALVAVALAVLTVAVEELLRAALRYWLRVV
ncbi:hypothetical protein ABZ499_08005 [Streptomyces sp. NPDC019990]|uniref:hypothetical protein n=1 Tax=Streptomyces sp. NPDC019990 TaxID=3154693 RepID=UPI0033F02713